MALRGGISLNTSGWSVGTAAGSDGGALEAGGVEDTESPEDSIVAEGLVETVLGVATEIDVLVGCVVGVLRGGDEVLGCAGTGVFVAAGVLVGDGVLLDSGVDVAAGTAVLVG